MSDFSSSARSHGFWRAQRAAHQLGHRYHRPRGLIIALKAIAGAVLGLVVLAAVYLLVVMFKG